MARRRKVTYPPPKTATKRAPSPLGAADPRSSASRTVVSINPEAIIGRASIGLGDRVRILSGLYEGEAAIVETVPSGVIPAAMVRTESGRARRARTSDLEPLPPARAPDTAPDPAAAAAPAPAPVVQPDPASSAAAEPAPAPSAAPAHAQAPVTGAPSAQRTAAKAQPRRKTGVTPKDPTAS
ncbi:MAG TPA: hypothetical protein VLA23_10585 [Candidatus Limnocylindrales bacterium]|nr:hypothetical protein [Candidatus Limnocylindrales bacterium]